MRDVDERKLSLTFENLLLKSTLDFDNFKVRFCMRHVAAVGIELLVFCY